MKFLIYFEKHLQHYSLVGLMVFFTGVTPRHLVGFSTLNWKAAKHGAVTFSELDHHGDLLKALGSTIEWNGVFPTEAFEWHREQALSVS